MPEGHTIHRIARDHQKAFSGQKLIVSSPQGRFEEEAVKLNGRKLNKVSAHGKHLFYHWAPGRGCRSGANLVHVHLGLYGKFRLHKNPAPEPRGAVRVRMIGTRKAFDLNGPTRCELLSKSDYRKLLNRLGQDPLKPDADPEMVWNRISRSRAAIGTLLLNQSVIAGLGNIYRAEILFLLGIHPEQSGSSLSRDQFDKLWKMCVDLLQIGVRYNRIITVDPAETGKPASRLKRDETLLVYKKNQCSTCNAKIKKWTLGARTMYACEKCQK
jgi:endonuclease-8